MQSWTNVFNFFVFLRPLHSPYRTTTIYNMQCIVQPLFSSRLKPLDLDLDLENEFSPSASYSRARRFMHLLINYFENFLLFYTPFHTKKQGFFYWDLRTPHAYGTPPHEKKHVFINSNFFFFFVGDIRDVQDPPPIQPPRCKALNFYY